MTYEVELLAPGGDIDSIKAAVIAGADAIYCGLMKFNARNRAANVALDELPTLIAFAHRHDCKIYLTLNIIILQRDLPELIRLLNKLANTNVDGVIVQDLGLLYLLSRYFPSLETHASTQLTTHNVGQLAFLAMLGATRVNLSRELNLHEITDMAAAGQAINLETEVFVHGSYCISFSGICYLSSVHGSKSGNRGKCSQPCRDQYLPTSVGKSYPLNLKDNSAFGNLQQLIDAGVDALKIEGRVKGYHYVYTVTHAYKAQLQRLYRHDQQLQDDGELRKVFNRGFSNGYLLGDLHKGMFADHARNQSAEHLSQENSSTTAAERETALGHSYDQIADNREFVKKLIDQESLAKTPATIRVSGAVGTPLLLSVQTPSTFFEVASTAYLAAQGASERAEQLTHAALLERLKSVNRTQYFIETLDVQSLQQGVSIPFKELTLLRNKLLFTLRGSKAAVAPIELPTFPRRSAPATNPTLAVLISSEGDLHLGSHSNAELHFQLPSALTSDRPGLVSLFRNNPELVPWFPSVLIGEDYAAAVDLLRQVQPGRIVTNNTGIAFEAWNQGVPWIAGPELNTANSYSLHCLQDRFDCTGAFLSNELSRDQIRGIVAPAGFHLYYRIYHPMTLLTSRQCLFHQVTGCNKEQADETCLHECNKTASITNTTQTSLLLNKSPGNFTCIYHESHFLNPEIVTDLPDTFSGFMIDLRGIETNTETDLSNTNLIALFEQLVDGDPECQQRLHQNLHPTSNGSYLKGM